MRIRPFVLVMTVSALALAGCTSPPAPPAASPSTAVSSTPTPTPTPTPEVESRLVLSVDALAYEHDGTTEEAAFSDGDALVDLIEGIAGEGVAEEFDGPYDSEGGTRYRWDGLVVSVYRVQFVEVELTGDAVVSLAAAGNDFSDI